MKQSRMKGVKTVKARIVESIKSAVKNGIKKLLVEVLKDDPQEHTVFSLPGIETAPVKGEKCLSIPTDISGKDAILGIVLKTDITDGEVKINGRNSAGQVLGFFYLKDDGQIQLGSQNFVPVVTEGFKPGYDTHTHDYLIGTTVFTTAPPKVGMLDTALSSKVKVE